MAKFPIILTGSYQAKKGDGDALHSFDRRKSDGFGGYMLTGSPVPVKHASKVKLDQGKGINQVLRELIAEGIKPDVTNISIKVNSDYSVNWSATINESKDGKAYYGIASRGSAGGGADERAKGQLPAMQSGAPNFCHWTVILDLNVKSPIKIRQYFIKYTQCGKGEKPNTINVDNTPTQTGNVQVATNTNTNTQTEKPPQESETPPPEQPTTPAKEISIINSTEAETETVQPIKFLSLDGEFLFNVQKDDFFIGNESVGDLYIIGKGEIYSKLEDSQLDAEYAENTFAGKEEVDPEFDPVEAIKINLLPKVDSENSPENPGEAQPVQQGEDVKINGGDLKTIKATGKWDGTKVKRLISGSSWQTRAANYIAKVEAGSKATLKAGWDVNHYRMGFGNQKIIKGGKIYDVTGTGPMSTCTAEEAITTLVNEGVPTYSDIIAKAIGKKYWDKLTGNQKAALTSLGYNVGAYYIGGRAYGKRIKQAIIDGNMEKAANEILNGPQSADGKVLSGLVRRRKEEASLFLLPDNVSIYGDGTV
jgi:GH24 family phage-related lysozyme (muramidase)